MDLDLADRSCVVLASSAGLGLACARALLEEGARVAISGRDPERLEAAASALAAEHGERVRAERLDVTDGAALFRHLAGVRERWGTVHALVLNAGGPAPGPAAEVDDAALDRAIDLNLRSAVRAVRQVLPWMREQRYGRVVALTSSSVREPIPNLALSSTARAGLVAWLKTLSREVAADGVLVNSICTGLFDTERLEALFRARAAGAGTSPEAERARAEATVPAGRAGDPAELAAVVAFLCSPRASYVSGVALPVDGGLSPHVL